MTRGRQPRSGTIWGCNKFPEIPSLSNGMDAASPPAGGGGWDRFLLMRSIKQGHNLSVSRCPVQQLEVREDQDKSD